MTDELSGASGGELDPETTELLGHLDACGIYEALRVLDDRLHDLAGSKRIVMHRDGWNEEFNDPDAAISVARASLDVAIRATKWMETLPHNDHGQP
jgi:hypothetical protein